MQVNNRTLSIFRTDVNGLRALAVVAVILYHFNTPGFNGGFVGVDVFFVISGYLMTGIVVKALEQGKFALSEFYMARARRILPALVVLCAVLMALGWFFLMAPDYRILSTQSLSALGFFSNFKFWDEAGYFDVASHEKWLLHTWSLSVEWQFYLVLPIVLLAVWRLKPGRAAQFGAILAGLVLSLGAAVTTTENQPSAAFFLLHTRAWEMLAGGLVFLLTGHVAVSITIRRWLQSAGLALILVATFLFDAGSPWPGWRATMPVLGTAMVVFANYPSAWIANSAVQWLGDRSYSLYLWHWPIYVALVYTGVQRDLLGFIGGIFLTLIFGHLSYTWVESFARARLTEMKLRLSLVAMLFAVGATASFALVSRQLDGINGRFSPEVELAAAEANNIYTRRSECHVAKGASSPSCVYGGSEWKVIGVGDSHLGALITSLAAAQPDGSAGIVQWSYSGCAFIPGVKWVNKKKDANYRCGDFIAWAKAQLDALPPTIPVVIVNRYAPIAFGDNEDPSEVFTPPLYISESFSSATPEFLKELAQQITNSACELAERRRVFVVRPIPEMGFDVPKTLSRRMARGLNGDLFISKENYFKRNGWVWRAQDAAQARCGVKILDPSAYLCDEDRCYGSKGGRPLYVDDDHLSEFGNKLLVPMFAEVFRSPAPHSAADQGLSHQPRLLK